jgi:hypothetical protein
MEWTEQHDKHSIIQLAGTRSLMARVSTNTHVGRDLRDARMEYMFFSPHALDPLEDVFHISTLHKLVSIKHRESGGKDEQQSDCCI